MPLGTIDRTPPPFFRQGPSALTKLVLCSALAVFLMAADTRFKMTQPLRAALATALLPVQRLMQAPVDMAQGLKVYLQGLDMARQNEVALRQRLAQLSERAGRTEQLAAENAELRGLLELRPALQVPMLSAEVLYEAADLYARRLVIDRGGQHGLTLGSPVINPAGVLGQVTRLYPLSAVVTLLVDKDAAISVLNQRTGQRGAAYGGADPSGQGGMELRFMAANADVQTGDLLVTSGVDGVYPPGLSVAKVAQVERRADTGFARVLLAPSAVADAVRHVLVLQPTAAHMLPRPLPGDPAYEAPPDAVAAASAAEAASAPASAADSNAATKAATSKRRAR